MKTIGYRALDFLESADPGERVPVAQLLREDPIAYREMIAHLTERPDLRAYRTPLSDGSAFVLLTGQQPALLGGPLYTLYKTATAVEIARRERETGRAAVAAFWCVGDDTDHGEVAGASWPRGGAPPARVRDTLDANGARIGGLAAGRMAEAAAALRADWPGADFANATIARILANGGSLDWSGFLRESLAALFPEDPILWIDGNDPFVIAAAQPLLRRFAPLRHDLADEIGARAAQARARGAPVAVGREEAGRCLMVVDGAGRRVLAPHEMPPPDGLLLPNVVLRPVVQEALLPVRATICGETEIAYRELIEPAHARAGQLPAPRIRRFAATLFPPLWGTDPGAPDPGRTLEDPDGALDAWALEDLEPVLLRALEAARGGIAEDLKGIASALERVDRSLVQVLASAQGKIDYQLRRIEEAVLAKARQSLRRRHPDLGHLREFLLPRGRPQERSFSLWTPFLWDGEGAGRSLREAVGAWLDRGGREEALLAPEEAG